MGRNSSGVYSKPAGTTALPNTVISSSAYNTQMDDIAGDLNAPRPVTAGGTGANSAPVALSNLGVTDFAKTLLDDADASAARTTLGALKATGYIPRDPIVLAADAGTITIPVNAAKRMKIAFRGRMSLTTADTLMAVSEDGGATYITAANSYGGPRGFGAAGSGPVNFFTNNSAVMAVAGNTADAAFEAASEIDIDIGAGSYNFRARVVTQSFSNGGSINLYQFSRVGPTQTHLRLFPAAGTFLTGTTVFVEDYFA